MVYEEKDYILRLIHQMVRMLIKLVFGKDIDFQEDAFLEEHGFSRQAVLDGIKYIVNAYGYRDLVDAFVE